MQRYNSEHFQEKNPIFFFFTLLVILGMTPGETAISSQNIFIIFIDYYLITRKGDEREYMCG